MSLPHECHIMSTPAFVTQSLCYSLYCCSPSSLEQFLQSVFEGHLWSTTYKEFFKVISCGTVSTKHFPRSSPLEQIPLHIFQGHLLWSSSYKAFSKVKFQMFLIPLHFYYFFFIVAVSSMYPHFHSVLIFVILLYSHSVLMPSCIPPPTLTFPHVTCFLTPLTALKPPPQILQSWALRGVVAQEQNKHGIVLQIEFQMLHITFYFI